MSLRHFLIKYQLIEFAPLSVKVSINLPHCPQVHDGHEGPPVPAVHPPLHTDHHPDHLAHHSPGLRPPSPRLGQVWPQYTQSQVNLVILPLNLHRRSVSQ